MLISLVFPCYREEPHLEANIDRVIETVRLLRSDVEIILVDDVSPDGTRNVIDKLIAKHPESNIRKVFHSSNLGRGAAFMSGFRESRGDFVGFFDVDLEVSPVYLLECIRLLNQGADLVTAKRYYKVSLAIFYRHVLSVAYSWLVSWFLGIPTSLDSESGYKFFRREALQRYARRFHNQGWFWDTEVVVRFCRDGLRVISFPCLFVRNGDKRSTVRPLHDSIQYFILLIGFKRLLRKESVHEVELERADKPAGAI
jgi:glycosyltransferase involved in cell wall biosynthesis